MGQEESDSWADRWALTIRQNIASVRGERQYSARELAERCSELGYPIGRSTIASIENGDRRGVTLPELAVLARALDVPPVRLLYDIRNGAAPVEVLPGVEVLPVDGLEWFAGMVQVDGQGLDDESADRGLVVARQERDARLLAAQLVGELARDRQDLSDSEAGIIPAWTPPSIGVDRRGFRAHFDAEQQAEQMRMFIKHKESTLSHAVTAMVEARGVLRTLGMTPPPVPESLQGHVEAMGGEG